jgi:hypothetical protein
LTSTSASDHGKPTNITVLTKRGTATKEMKANKYSDKYLSLGRLILRSIRLHFAHYK